MADVRSSFSSSCHHHLHRDLAAAIPTYRGDFVRPSALPAALSIPAATMSTVRSLALPRATPLRHRRASHGVHQRRPPIIAVSIVAVDDGTVYRAPPRLLSADVDVDTVAAWPFEPPILVPGTYITRPLALTRLFEPESSNTLASSHSASAAAQTGRARRLSDPPEHITDVARSNCSQGRTGGHRQHVRRTPGFGTPS
ncbi:hypothetical protein AURDEDRAFT_160857, partial [Auricularia subglabra TFB-10046 SS5]